MRFLQKHLRNFILQCWSLVSPPVTYMYPSVIGIQNRPFSAVIEVKLEYKILNALLDTGASCSIIDLRTIQNLGFDKIISRECGKKPTREGINLRDFHHCTKQRKSPIFGAN